GASCERPGCCPATGRLDKVLTTAVERQNRTLARRRQADLQPRLAERPLPTLKRTLLPRRLSLTRYSRQTTSLNSAREIGPAPGPRSRAEVIRKILQPTLARLGRTSACRRQPLAGRRSCPHHEQVARN